MTNRFAMILTAMVLTVMEVQGQEQSAAPMRPMLYASQYAKKVLQYDAAGTVVWEYPVEMCRDASRLPNGNVLFCYNENYKASQNNNPGGVREVTPDKRIVFEYRTAGQVWSCQRLADGTTMVGASSQGKLLIVDAAGKLVREIKLRSPGGHSCMRNARQTADGHFLVAEEGASFVREYAADGALLREIKLTFRPYTALRLPNGNIMVSGRGAMAEIDTGNAVVWTLSGADVPQLGVSWLAGLQVLPNGNLLVCNAGGKVNFAEISRDKRVVWQSKGTFPAGHGIQVLDVQNALR